MKSKTQLKDKMYRLIFRVCLFAVVFLFLGTTESKAIVSDFRAFLYVNDDATIEVIEKITSDGKDGFSRVLFKNQDGFYGFKIVSLTKDGKEEKYEIENNKDFVKISLKQEKSEDNAVYELHYKIINAIKNGKDYDSLKYDILKKGFLSPVKQAFAMVNFPKNIEILAVNNDDGNIKQNIVNNKAGFATVAPFQKKLAMTININFSKGIVFSKQNQDMASFSFANIRILLILVFLYYLVLWAFFGKDDKLGEIVVVHHPKMMISIGKSAGVFFSKTADMPRLIVASMINLAQTGYIVITKNHKDEISIKRTGKLASLIAAEEEKALIEGLFFNADEVFFNTKNPDVFLDENEKIFKSAFSKYRKIVENFREKLIKQNPWVVILGVVSHFSISAFFYFNGDIFPLLISLLCGVYVPFVWFIYNKIRVKSYISSSILSIFILVQAVFSFVIFYKYLFLNRVLLNAENTILVFSLLVLMVILIYTIHMVFYYLMDKPNAAATRLITELSGIKKFIETAEDERYVKVTTLVFEENLPFSVLFDKDDEWIRDFSMNNFGFSPVWIDGFFDENLFKQMVDEVRRIYLSVFEKGNIT